MKRRIIRTFALLFVLGVALIAFGRTEIQAVDHGIAVVKPTKNISLNKEIVIFKENDWYGYKNTKTGKKTSADYSLTWPFLDDRACAMRGDGGFEMLDRDLKVIWRSRDLEELAPKIGQYENMSSEQFAAALKQINEMTTKKGGSPLKNYYDSLDYIQKVYGKNLHAYKPGMVNQWSKALIQSVSESQEYFLNAVTKYHQYYQMQNDMQEYFKKRIKYWTPHY